MGANLSNTRLSMNGSRYLFVALGLIAVFLVILELRPAGFTAPSEVISKIIDRPSPEIVEKPPPEIVEKPPQELEPDPPRHYALTDQEATELCKKHKFDLYQPNREKRKVYDLFLLGYEMEWLEIRLHTLDPVVDYFVIVEGTHSFSNKPKPMYYKENYARFEKFAHKIIYRIVQFDGIEVENTTPWTREAYQRKALFTHVFPGLVGEQAANEDDVILVSDLDEVPKEESLVILKNCRFPERTTLRSNFYYYSFQWRHHGSDWNFPHATVYKGSKTILPGSLRNADIHTVIENASWHCSSCFKTVHQLQQKIESFSHVEFDQPQFKDAAKIVNRVRNGLDLFDRKDQHYDKEVDNHDIPTFLRLHPDRFPWLVDRDPANANFVDYNA